MEKQNVSALNIISPFIILGLVVWLALWYFFGRYNIGDPVYSLTAGELVDAFESDEIAATAKYADKTVRFTGKYTASGVSLGAPWIVFEGRAGLTGLTGVQCYFKDAESAMLVPKDKPVKIDGVVRGLTIYVQLEKCRMAW